MRDIEKILEEVQNETLPFRSWERLPGEGAAAYGAFCAYRDLGPERSIRRAAEGRSSQSGSEPEARSARRYRAWRDFSLTFQWVRRAADYDGYLDKLKQAELRRTIEARGEAHREVTGKMLRAVSKKLDLMNPADISPGTVTEWVQAAIKTEREIFGLAAGKEKPEAGKPGGIAFTPEFEGL